MIECKPISFGIFGPAAPVVDNAIATFDETTGRKIQASAVTIDDSGNLVMADGAAIKVADGNPQIIFDNANNWLEITGDVGIGTATPGAKLDIENSNGKLLELTAIGTGNVSPFFSTHASIGITGADLRMFQSYGSRDSNIGSSSIGWITSYAYELDPGVVAPNNFKGWAWRVWDGSSYQQYFNIGSDGNIGIGTPTFPASMVGGMAIKLGTEPTGDVANQYAISAFDFAVGNTCPRLRTENGTLIGLNQGLLTTDNVTHNRLALTGGFKANLVTKTGNYTTTADDYTILCDASGGSFTIDLLAAASYTNGIYHLKKIDSSANTIPVDGNGSETIDGALTAVLTAPYESITIQSDGSNWWII